MVAVMAAIMVADTGVAITGEDGEELKIGIAAIR